MTTKGFGILALFLLVAAIGTGTAGILKYSGPAAVGYLVSTLLLMFLFIYAFCAKCRIRDQCVHVVMGLITRAMPGRDEGPYNPAELAVVLIFFGFIAIFPQYWLVRDPVFLFIFWILFTGEWILTHFTLCRGCGNRYCCLRYDKK
jgi:hypothetical protein